MLAFRPLNLSLIPGTHMNEWRQMTPASLLLTSLTCVCLHTHILTCIHGYTHTYTQTPTKVTTSLIEIGLLYSKECFEKGGNESEIIFSFKCVSDLVI